MSKKIVQFKMPAKVALGPQVERGQDRSPTISASAEQALPISPRGGPETESIVSEPDQWVQHRDIAAAFGPAPIELASRPYAPVATRSLMVDVSAERDFQEVMVMALLIPPMLGWFWLFNVMNRYWNTIS
jgi:hypothetical protein